MYEYVYDQFQSRARTELLRCRYRNQANPYNIVLVQIAGGIRKAGGLVHMDQETKQSRHPNRNQVDFRIGTCQRNIDWKGLHVNVAKKGITVFNEHHPELVKGPCGELWLRHTCAFGSPTRIFNELYDAMSIGRLGCCYGFVCWVPDVELYGYGSLRLSRSSYYVKFTSIHDAVVGLFTELIHDQHVANLTLEAVLRGQMSAMNNQETLK